MLPNHRPSILKRPIRPSSQCNEENMEKEYQQQQDYWKHRANRLAEAEDRVRRSIYPDKDLQRDEQANMRELMDRQLREIQERRVRDEIERRNSFIPEKVTAEHPWAHGTDDAMQRRMADVRRQMARDALEENQRLVHIKREQERQTDLLEKKLSANATRTEESWWNYGAASDRWLPKERRTRPASAVVQERSGGEAPYSWSFNTGPGSEPEPRRSRAAAAAPAPAQSSLPPYAWIEQPEGPARRGVQQAAPAPAGEIKRYPWSWDA